MNDDLSKMVLTKDNTRGITLLKASKIFKNHNCVF